jgi:hypothetical protein
MAVPPINLAVQAGGRHLHLVNYDKLAAYCSSPNARSTLPGVLPRRA